jgi:uncharacterized OsmC-like protein
VLEYKVTAQKVKAEHGRAYCKRAELLLDTEIAGSEDAFNPAEMLLAAVAACMIKGVERAKTLLRFESRGVEITVHGVRQDSPPKMIRISYRMVVDTDESDNRLNLLHKNLKQFGTIFNTIAASTELSGSVERGRIGSIEKSA